MKIGIIAAEFEEMIAIKNTMKNISENKIFDIIFYIGNINNRECILVQCGVGKVNAARATQILIDRYTIDYVINVGTAGSTTKELNIKDIVIGKELMQYDFDISQISNYEKGEVCGIGKYFYSDEKLIKLCQETIEEMRDRNFKIEFGRIGSADVFFADPQKALSIRQEFGIECLEMEGAAVAQVCFLDNVPFIVIRGISDVPDGNNRIDFHTYLKVVSKQIAEFLQNLISKIF